MSLTNDEIKKINDFFINENKLYNFKKGSTYVPLSNVDFLNFVEKIFFCEKVENLNDLIKIKLSVGKIPSDYDKGKLKNIKNFENESSNCFMITGLQLINFIPILKESINNYKSELLNYDLSNGKFIDYTLTQEMYQMASLINLIYGKGYGNNQVFQLLLDFKSQFWDYYYLNDGKKIESKIFRKTCKKYNLVENETNGHEDSLEFIEKTLQVLISILNLESYFYFFKLNEKIEDNIKFILKLEFTDKLEDIIKNYCAIKKYVFSHLIVSVNRIDEMLKKITDDKEMPDTITLEHPFYTTYSINLEMKCFIKHLGATSASGHYVFYFKHKGKFYLLDSLNSNVLNDWSNPLSTIDVERAIKTSNIYLYSRT
jgi:hypothetical protein